MTRKDEIKKGNAAFFLVAAAFVTAIWPYGHGQGINEITGTVICVSAFFSVLYLYLLNFCPEILKVNLKTVFLLIVIISFFLVTRIVLSYSSGKTLLLLVPYALAAVVVRTFYDGRIASVILLVTLLLSGILIPDPFEFVTMNFLTGLAAVYILSDLHRKGKAFLTALTVALGNMLMFASFRLMKEGNLDTVALSDLLVFAGNGLLLLLTYPLIFVFEKRFRFLSDTTLLELSDTNQPLLRKLADEAPGSFQHSLQVANLAEEAARVTGANPLLARAGALYHDIGKIAGPAYYAENQGNGTSLHDSMDPVDSARIIINHVNSGIILARNFRLPVQIIDFIKTHHGTSVAFYFYKKFTEKQHFNTGQEKDFTYPGPKPFSKETAIVMMADAVEASSRSLGKQNEENINETVERIILLQEQSGQFSEVPFTFKDISDIKEAFKKRLVTMYHGRIAYQ
ncbi:MAG TPA: HDIG domain-containing protein [Bacteroidales bacterium]|nr:HDIG domain-containing protein [Bacteroidales bacterium]